MIYPIIGMHRSGTSMVAGIISKKVFLGNDQVFFPPADEDNPKGYFENDLFRRINDNLLKYYDYDVKHWNPEIIHKEPSTEKKFYFLRKFRTFLKYRIVSLYNAQRIVNAYSLKYTHWGWKDPRTTLLLEEWEHLFKSNKRERRYIFVFRHPISVAKSLLKRGNVNSISHGLALWYSYNRKMYEFMIRLKETEYVIFSFEELINNPRSIISKLAEIEILMEDKDYLDFIDPGLNRNRTNSDDNCNLEKLINNLYEELQLLSTRDLS